MAVDIRTRDPAFHGRNCQRNACYFMISGSMALISIERHININSQTFFCAEWDFQDLLRLHDK
ncbi:MAG: hypothetical protein IBX40_12865 [Methanosarcinales archaeon]|nr:hypothetical protein [Methanosarcinales archaeon]